MATVRVYLGSDHAGFELKAHLLEHLKAAGHDTVDVGAQRYEADDDYPPFCLETARRVVADPGKPGHRAGRFRQRRADRREQGAWLPRRAGLEHRDGDRWPGSTTTPRWSASAPACNPR